MISTETTSIDSGELLVVLLFVLFVLGCICSKFASLRRNSRAGEASEHAILVPKRREPLLPTHNSRFLEYDCNDTPVKVYAVHQCATAPITPLVHHPQMRGPIHTVSMLKGSAAPAARPAGHPNNSILPRPVISSDKTPSSHHTQTQVPTSSFTHVPPPVMRSAGRPMEFNTVLFIGQGGLTTSRPTLSPHAQDPNGVNTPHN